MSCSGLAGPARGAIDLTGGVARVRCGKLDVDRAQFGGLTGAAHRRLAAELLQFFLSAPPETCSGVQIGPGATPLTRMPFGASCLASDFT